jgi:hypothetical protein
METTPILPSYRAISLRQYRKRIPTRGGSQVTFGEGSLLCLISDDVSQGRLSHLSGKTGYIACPIAETGAEAVNCCVFDFHSAHRWYR